MIGAGVVGIATAWLLQARGHRVCLIDPRLADEGDGPGGSAAALGLLMAQVYRRSSGRGWRLRQQSLALWRLWRDELASRGRPIPWRPGLLQLAGNDEELAIQARLVQERRARGCPLQLLSREELQAWRPQLPAEAVGGLLSPADGQLDPSAAMAALLADAREGGLQTLGVGATRLERRAAGGGEGRWAVHLTTGATSACDWVVLCAGLESPALLEPLGHQRPLSPVLGQALELELPPGCGDAGSWLGSVSWDGINLVPRPEGRLWLGATLEPGATANAAAREGLRQLNGAAPDWLRRARVIRHWMGSRARPVGRPAPLLERLEEGLLLASGHYRNGVLLAPASAAWVADQIAS
ncbi:MAG: hypothetical protein RLZZ589_782 [Cyanobacteriota bacterium]